MKNYPKLFSQRDPQWAGIQLGNAAGSTLGDYGCYDTCFAMIACYFGKDTNPAKLNQDFKAGNIYVNANLLTDDALNKIYGDIQYVGSDHYESVPADLSKLQSYMQDDSLTVTLCIDMGVNGYHFVEAVDCDGKTVTIANPWTGNVEPFSNLYGNPVTQILRYIVYKGVVKKMVQVPSDDFEGLVFKSTQHDKMVPYLGLNDPRNTTFEDEQKVVAGYKSRATDLQTKLDVASSEASSRTEQVGRLQGQLTDEVKLRGALTDKLNATVNSMPGIQKVYEDRIGVLQGQIDQMGRDKGQLNATIQTLTTKVNDLAKGQVSSLTAKDLAKLLVKKLTGR